MRGYPSFLNTKEDYYNMLEIDPAETVNRLRILRESVHTWRKGEEIPLDETFKDTDTACAQAIYELDDEGKIVQKKYVFHKVKVEDCLLSRMGFTLDEVNDLITKHS